MDRAAAREARAEGVWRTGGDRSGGGRAEAGRDGDRHRRAHRGTGGLPVLLGARHLGAGPGSTGARPGGRVQGGGPDPVLPGPGEGERGQPLRVRRPDAGHHPLGGLAGRDRTGGLGGWRPRRGPARRLRRSGGASSPLRAPRTGRHRPRPSPRDRAGGGGGTGGPRRLRLRRRAGGGGGGGRALDPSRCGKDAPVKPVEWRDGVLRILDQTRLPAEERFMVLRTPEDVAGAIRAMAVRGAPLLGITAAFGLALAANRSDARSAKAWLRDLDRAGRLLVASRPTAVNVAWAVDRVLGAARSDDSAPTPGSGRGTWRVDDARRAVAREAPAIASEDETARLASAGPGAAP